MQTRPGTCGPLMGVESWNRVWGTIREILGTRLPFDSGGAQDMPARFLQAIGMNIQIWVVLAGESNQGLQNLKQPDSAFYH